MAWTKEKPCPQYVRDKISKKLKGVIIKPDRFFICDFCGKENIIKDIAKYNRSKKHYCSLICCGLSKKGKKLTKEHREKVIKTLKYRFNLGVIPWNKNKKIPENGGDKCHFWKGGITKLSIKIRSSFENRSWIRSVLERDNYTCQKCNKIGGELVAHHIKDFSKILKDNNISNYDQALTCHELWDVNNGQTLCVDCHFDTESFPKQLKSYFKNKTQANMKLEKRVRTRTYACETIVRNH